MASPEADKFPPYLELMCSCALLAVKCGTSARSVIFAVGMGHYSSGGRTLSCLQLNLGQRANLSFSTRIVFCFLLLILSVEAAADWHYSEDSWTGACQDGKRQSPVDLNEEKAKVEVTEPLIFLRYDRPVQANLSNNGHTVVLNVEQQCEVAIASGGLRGVYQLDEIHFHWEAEHTIVGVRLPLEVHFVHHNVIFGNISHALQHPQGLAVVAVLFHEVDYESSNMVPVLDALEETAGSVGESTPLAVPFSPATLLPDDRSHFYRYQGSLTTPPCTESVVWTIMHSSVPISKFQLEKFRTVNSTSGLLDANFRRSQPLNGRTVYLIIDDEVDIKDNDISSASTSQISHKTLFPVVIISLAAFKIIRL